MESTRGRNYHSYKTARSTFPYHRHHHNHHHENTAQPGRGIYKFQHRKELYSRENYRSKLSYKIIDINNKKSSKTIEEEEEEERKKKLKETSKKLLNKIKAWNAERNCSENDSQQNFSNNEVDTESSCKNNEEKVSSEDNSKKVTHSKKAMIVKSRTPKSFNQPVKALTKHDVNKETIKDFKNRIHHKLIEELLQMPKENLRNILNDPKINHIMDLKISRLVRESNSLMSQKFRSFAEFKIQNSLNFSSNSQLLIDIDKLIDPVIETDLSALPSELIKQMENILQVQFDYSQNEMDSQVKSDVCVNPVAADDVEMETNSVDEENNGDLNVYECLTDEDEEISSVKSSTSVQKDDSCLLDEVINKETDETSLSDEVLIKKEIESCVVEVLTKKPEECLLGEILIKEESKSCGLDEVLTKEGGESCLMDDVEGTDEPGLLNEVLIKKENESCLLDEALTEVPESDKMESEDEQRTSPKHPESLQDFVDNCLSSKNFISSESSPEKTVQNITTTEFTSASSQTDYNYEDASTQTQTNSQIVETVYGVPIPEETTNECISSLLKEVNSIQNLINKLNERRLMIFLQLSRMNPSGSFLNDENTKKNFIESMSNGSFSLVESLKHFFSTHLHETCRSSGSSSKSPKNVFRKESSSSQH